MRLIFGIVIISDSCLYIVNSDSLKTNRLKAVEKVQDIQMYVNVFFIAFIRSEENTHLKVKSFSLQSNEPFETNKCTKGYIYMYKTGKIFIIRIMFIHLLFSTLFTEPEKKNIFSYLIFTPLYDAYREHHFHHNSKC